MGEIVRTSISHKTFHKRDATNWSYELYKITKVIDDTIPSYDLDFFPQNILKVHWKRHL